MIFFSIFNGQDDDDDDEHNDHANGHSQHWPNDQTDNMISHYVDAKKIIITKKITKNKLKMIIFERFD